MLAWVALGFLLVALYGLVTLYAAFDRWAEHSASGTPFAKTIPTLLGIALLYELFPLDHFHFVLPITAVLIALAADWTKYRWMHEQNLHPWQSDAPGDTEQNRTAPVGEDQKGEMRDV